MPGTSERRVAVLEVALGALLLLAPTLLNGYPLVYPDTGTYLLQAIELYGAPDRPPFYSLLIFPFHLKFSLWPVVVMQAVTIAVALRMVMRTLGAGASGLRYLGTVAVLALFTSLPWHAGQVMPDAFTPLLALLAFELAYGWERHSRRERALLGFVATGTATLHFSHLPLAAGLFAAAALVRLAQGFGRRDAARVLAVGLGVCMVTAAAFTAYSYALVHKVRLSPSGSVFLAARFFEDGTGKRYLAESCPASGNIFCEYQDRLRDAWSFLWEPSSPLRDAVAAHGEEAVAAACGEIVSGVLRTRPLEQAGASLRNGAAQLVRFGALDTNCPEDCGEERSVNRTLKRYFGREYDRFRGSLQMRGALPVLGIRRVNLAVIVAGAGAFLALVAAALRRRDHLAVGFATMVTTAVVGNAVIAGSLSTVVHRYQSRVIWLVPFAALALLLRGQLHGAKSLRRSR